MEPWGQDPLDHPGLSGRMVCETLQDDDKILKIMMMMMLTNLELDVSLGKV